MSNSPEQLCAACPNQTALRKLIEFALRSGETADGCEGPLRVHRGQAESATVKSIYRHGRLAEVIGEEQDMKDWHSMSMHTEHPNLKDLESDDFLLTIKTDTYHRTDWSRPAVQCGREPVAMAEDEMLYGEFQGSEYQDDQGRRNVAIVRGTEEQRSQQRGMSAVMYMLDNVEPDISVTKDSDGNIHTEIKES